MSIERLQNIFAALPNCNAWSLQLLKIKTSKRVNTSYMGREITFTPPGKLNEFVSVISQRYINEEKGVLNSFFSVTDYDGSTIDKTVYKLNVSNELIREEYEALIAAIAIPDVEIDPLTFKARAYLLKGSILIDGEQHPVKMISMQNPINHIKSQILDEKWRISRN